MTEGSQQLIPLVPPKRTVLTAFAERVGLRFPVEKNPPFVENGVPVEKIVRQNARELIMAISSSLKATDDTSAASLVPEGATFADVVRKALRVDEYDAVFETLRHLREPRNLYRPQLLSDTVRRTVTRVDSDAQVSGYALSEVVIPERRGRNYEVVDRIDIDISHDVIAGNNTHQIRLLAKDRVDYDSVGFGNVDIEVNFLENGMVAFRGDVYPPTLTRNKVPSYQVGKAGKMLLFATDGTVMSDNFVKFTNELYPRPLL